MPTLEKLIDAIKCQAEIFLLDAGEFYPFGTYIDNNNCVIPVGSYSESDMPESQELIDLFDKYFKCESVKNYKLAALALDVLLKTNGVKVDALEIRLYEAGKEVSRIHLKYIINKHNVEFNN
jgi:hypothetical protein